MSAPLPADHLDPHLLVPHLHADTKIGAIKELIDRLHGKGIVADSLSFLQAVLERENLQSTILEDDVALPHACCRAVRELGLALGIARPALDFPSGDDRRPIRLICLVAVPVHLPDRYLALQASLARLFQDAYLKESLLNAASAENLYHLLTAHPGC